MNTPEGNPLYIGFASGKWEMRFSRVRFWLGAQAPENFPNPLSLPHSSEEVALAHPLRLPHTHLRKTHSAILYGLI